MLNTEIVPTGNTTSTNANMNPPPTENMSFTKEQIDLLYKIMGKSKVSLSSRPFAQSRSHGKTY